MVLQTVLIVCTLSALATGQVLPSSTWAEPVIREVQNAAFPELATVKIAVRAFRSNSDYMQANLSVRHLLFGRRMAYVVRVNPALVSLQAPAASIRAIAAHELAHVVFYNRGSRWRLIGMVRYGLSSSWRSRFEQEADRTAIRRGFGKGLADYRSWLYGHIPAKHVPSKLRDYLSPEQIVAYEESLGLGLKDSRSAAKP